MRRMTRGIAACAPLLLLSAAPPPPSLSPSATGAARCVQQNRVSAPYIDDHGRLFFRGQPDPRQSYVAVFKGGACPGLTRMSAVTIETTGVGYCEGDKVRAFTPPVTILGPSCIIDRMEPAAQE